MGFDGPALSFDDEGSILFDGEKIIVTVPVGHEALDHLGSEKEIPFPVVYTHPSHHQDQRPSTPPPPSGGNPVFNKEKARESVERARRERESARDEKSKSGKKDVKDNSPADRAPVTDKRDLASDAIDEEPAAEAVWQDYTPLTPGQQMHVDNLLRIETDNLAREVLITLKREGLPPNDQWREFLEQYALTGWYTASDAIAWATLAKIANSEWDETFAYADEDHVETVAQDLGDNAIEGVVVIDAETGDTLFDRTGVVRADGSQYVGMQDTEADALLAEALSGRDLIFVHNHTEEVGASDEDRNSAFAAGAKLLIVITQQGQEYVYIRGRYTMVEVRDEKASYEVGQVNPEETEELHDKSEEQAAAFQVDTPEWIFEQNQPSLEIKISGTMSFHVYHEHGLHLINDTFDDSTSHQVLGKSRYNPYIVSIKLHSGEVIGVDLQNMGDDVSISGLNLADLPTIDDDYPPTAEEVVQSFQEKYSPIGTVDIFPIAQDPAETEIIQFAIKNERYTTVPDKRHPGIDFFAPAGTEAISVTEGEVIGIYIPSRTDFDYDAYGTDVEDLKDGGIMIDPRQLYSNNPAGYSEIRRDMVSGILGEKAEGAHIIVRTGNTYFIYAHLDPRSIQVGMEVKAGQVIGQIAGDHLHFETRIHGDQTVYIDSETGDYVYNPNPKPGEEELLPKPLVAVNPIHYFDNNMQSAINYGLDLRNRQKEHLEQGNVDTDAVSQNTHIIDLGSKDLYAYTRLKRNIQGVDQLQFSLDLSWIDQTSVVLVE